MSGYNKGKHRSLKGNAALTAVTVLLGCAVIAAAVLLLKKIPTVRSASSSSGVSQQSSAIPQTDSSSKATAVPSKVSSSSVAKASSAVTSAPVTSDTFKNALFVGDSFVEGLTVYGNIGVSSTIGKNAMSTYTAVNRDYTINNKKQLIEDGAATINPGSIYIMIGSNDLALGRTATKFAYYYGELVTGLQSKCKSTKIYVQSVFPVTAAYEQKANSGVYITNAKIESYNTELKAMCSEKGVTYVDVASVLKGADGKLLSSLSSDGIHLKKAGYTKWLSYLASCAGGKTR